MKPTRTEGEPHDRMTRLCATMTDALEANPEYAGEKAALFLRGEDNRMGLVMFGYDDDAEAVADLFAHLAAIFEANGKQLLIAPLRGGPDS